MVDYICYRCFYKTDRKSNIETHLKRLIKCPLKSSNSEIEIERLNNEQFDKKRIYIGLKAIRRLYNSLSFEDDTWYIDHISEMDKYLLLFSGVMYSKLLEKILENDLNHNVIIDNDYGIGMIIVGKKDLYKKIDMLDINIIIEKTYNKLEEHLKNIYKEFNEKYNDYSCDIDDNILKRISEEKGKNNREMIEIFMRYREKIINKINERKKIIF